MSLIKTALLSLILPMSMAWASDIRVPPQLKTAVQAEGVSLHSEFKVSDEIRGLVLKRGIDYFVVYETKDGNLVQGTIIDPSGKNLTAEHMQTQVPQRDLKLATSMVDKLGPDSYVVEGAKKSKQKIYLFVDLNCGYCYYLWKATRPYVEKYPDLQLRWVPVAVLGDDSGVKAAHILADSSNLEVFLDYKRNYRKTKGDPDGMTSKGRDLTLQNNETMRSLGYSGTPAILFVDAKGNAGEAKGMPRLQELAEILGKPYIPTDDPQLKRFAN